MRRVEPRNATDVGQEPSNVSWYRSLLRVGFKAGISQSSSKCLTVRGTADLLTEQILDDLRAERRQRHGPQPGVVLRHGVDRQGRVDGGAEVALGNRIVVRLD